MNYVAEKDAKELFVKWYVNGDGGWLYDWQKYTAGNLEELVAWLYANGYRISKP